MGDKNLKKIIEKISAQCLHEPAIDAAYLLGSSARGKRRQKSDIDVAVLLDGSSLEEFSTPAFISSLEKACGCRVDVVILNRAGEILKGVSWSIWRRTEG